MLARGQRGRLPSRSPAKGIDRLIELHGNLDVIQINRTHVREFRDAAQLVPKHRAGKLRDAPLPELVAWSRKHPGTVCIVAATINKWLNCLGAVLNWARKNGLIPDNVAWSDPVAGMRLPEARSQRQPWEPEELSLLFASPIYLSGERPAGGKGEAAYWLPLLALFSGARVNELAPLCADDIKHDPASDAHSILFSFSLFAPAGLTRAFGGQPSSDGQFR